MFDEMPQRVLGLGVGIIGLLEAGFVDGKWVCCDRLKERLRARLGIDKVGKLSERLAKCQDIRHGMRVCILGVIVGLLKARSLLSRLRILGLLFGL